MPAEPSKGWLERIFGKRKKKDKKKKKGVVEKAIKGYERKGGIMGRLRKGMEDIKDMPKSKKKKGNPHY